MGCQTSSSRVPDDDLPDAIKHLNGTWKSSEGKRIRVAGDRAHFNNGPPRQIWMKDGMAFLNGWAAHEVSTTSVYWQKGSKRIDWQRVGVPNPQGIGAEILNAISSASLSAMEAPETPTSNVAANSDIAFGEDSDPFKMGSQENLELQAPKEVEPKEKDQSSPALSSVMEGAAVVPKEKDQSSAALGSQASPVQNAELPIDDGAGPVVVEGIDAGSSAEGSCCACCG